MAQARVSGRLSPPLPSELRARLWPELNRDDGQTDAALADINTRPISKFLMLEKIDFFDNSGFITFYTLNRNMLMNKIK